MHTEPEILNRGIEGYAATQGYLLPASRPTGAATEAVAMVSAKKDPNRVRGSGAERRKENKATGKPVSLKKLKSMN